MKKTLTVIGILVVMMTIVGISIVSVAFAAPVQTVPAAAQVGSFDIGALSDAQAALGCESTFLPEGQCVTDLQILNETPVWNGVVIDPYYSESQWKITVTKDFPSESVFPPFNINLNNYDLELVDVYVDQRVKNSPPVNEGEFFDGVYIFVRGSCKLDGSKHPSLVFTMPRQEIQLADGTMYNRIPRSIALFVVNWKELTENPCSY